MMSSEESLVACVICEGDRGSEWAKLLTKHFRKVYVISSNSNCSVFSPDSKQGKSIPCKQLPSLIDVVLFHTGNENLWFKSKLKTRYTFEFNKVGSPCTRQGEKIYSIQRQTCPFDIYESDIEELFEYIVGSRKLLPTMCFPRLEVSPAIFSLCQEYLVAQDKSEVVQSLHWLEVLDCLQDAIPNQQRLHKLQQDLTREWKLVASDDHLSTSLSKLLEAISQPESVISLPVVTDAYSVLASKLALPTVELLHQSLPAKLPPFEAKTILALKGNPASMAVADVLSRLLCIPRQIINPANQLLDWKSLRRSILVLAESQVVSKLANLRSQGFSGAVLVVSTQPFAQIKRNYRVLRFGQGSHDAFEQPWSLSSLLAKAIELVPMEPENLQFLQNEIKAPEHLYEQKIEPSLKRLREPDGSPKNLVEAEAVVEQVRAATPVACHAMVTIAGEQKQVQQHLQAALTMLEDHGQYWQGIQRLEKAFEAWRERVTLVTEVPVQ